MHLSYKKNYLLVLLLNWRIFDEIFISNVIEKFWESEDLFTIVDYKGYSCTCGASAVGRIKNYFRGKKPIRVL